MGATTNTGFVVSWQHLVRSCKQRAKDDDLVRTLLFYIENESHWAAPLNTLIGKTIRSVGHFQIAALWLNSPRIINSAVVGFTYDKLPHLSPTRTWQRQSHPAAAAPVHQGQRTLTPDRTQIIAVTTWAHMSAQMMVMSWPLNFLISTALLT